MIKKILMMALTCILFTQSVAAQTVDWGAKSRLLEQGMGEARVGEVLGYGPNKVELKTCGSESSGGPWSCKIHTYGSTRTQQLRVSFAQINVGHGTVWVVNSWSIYDW